MEQENQQTSSLSTSMAEDLVRFFLKYDSILRECVLSESTRGYTISLRGTKYTGHIGEGTSVQSSLNKDLLSIAKKHKYTLTYYTDGGIVLTNPESFRVSILEGLQ